MDKKPNHVLATRDLAHLRPLGLLREGDDAIDFGLDFIERPVDVGARLEPRDHGAETLGSGCLYPVEPLNAPDLLLDPLDDRLLDLPGRRPGIEDKNLDLIQRQLRKHLLNQVPGRRQTREDQEQHQHVGGHAVSGHEGDRPGAVARRDRLVGSTGVAGHQPAFLPVRGILVVERGGELV